VPYCQKYTPTDCFFWVKGLIINYFIFFVRRVERRS